jgi:hypothetical protein
VDPWVGSGMDHKLPEHMIQTLRTKGLFKLSQIVDPGVTDIWGQGWLTADNLDFRSDDIDAWGGFVARLKRIQVNILKRMMSWCELIHLR